jgi:hypothetical protein
LVLKFEEEKYFVFDLTPKHYQRCTFMKMYGVISEWGERTFVHEHLLCKRRNLEATGI